MIFEASSPLGQMVVYTDSARVHIEDGHPEMAGQEKAIKQVIEDPQFIYRSKDFPDTRDVYYRLDAHPDFKGFFLAVVVEKDPEPAAVVTSYPQPKIHGVLEGGLIYVNPKR